jgi:hypothetical protein
VGVGVIAAAVEVVAATLVVALWVALLLVDGTYELLLLRDEVDDETTEVERTVTVVVGDASFPE